MLLAAEIAAYRRDGYLVARNVLAGAEVEALHREAERLWRDAGTDPDRPGVHWRKHETLGRVADRLDPVSTISEPYAAVARDGRMTGLAADALGARSAFFKDKLIMKPPGAFGYELHNDYAYWADLGATADEFVTLFLALDPSDAASGAVELFPGLHRRTLAPHPDDPLDIDPAAVGGERSIIPTLAAGDVLLFHGLIPHRSAPNRSERSRRVYIVTYMHGRHAGRINAGDSEHRKLVYRALARDNV
jgi:ectoine hydroxylase-related dioxygenase (phytanoyl-CoA dioxygenase family)